MSTLVTSKPTFAEQTASDSCHRPRAQKPVVNDTVGTHRRVWCPDREKPTRTGKVRVRDAVGSSGGHIVSLTSSMKLRATEDGCRPYGKMHPASASSVSEIEQVGGIRGFTHYAEPLSRKAYTHCFDRNVKLERSCRLLLRVSYAPHSKRSPFLSRIPHIFQCDVDAGSFTTPLTVLST